MIASVGTALCVVLLTSLLVLGLFWSWARGRARKGCVAVLFIDAPDPDNPSCVIALWNAFICTHVSPRHLHIVLTGRPVDLKTGKTFRDDKPLLGQIPRQEWEETVESHAQRLLQDCAVRISHFLRASGLGSQSFTIYNGGIAPSAPLSDVCHDWDFLFDRKDLVTGRPGDEGQVLSPTEYQDLIQRYNQLTDRETTFLSLLRKYRFTPLSELKDELRLPRNQEVSVFIGGPATAVVDLFEGDEICHKVSQLYAMFGALQPGENTLLDNQFNVACDIGAATKLFMGNMFPNIPHYLIPTETCKHPEVVVSASELEMRNINSYVTDLLKVWESTHRLAPQPLFDVLPVMAALPQYGRAFVWNRKKVVLQEWRDNLGKFKQRFLFADSETSNLFVSDGCFHCNKELYLEFLELAFQRVHDS